MIVAVVRIPRSCASLMILSHSWLEIFPGQMTFRTSSTSISAAVPQSDPSPASFMRESISRVEMPLFLAPYATSIGLLAWM